MNKTQGDLLIIIGLVCAWLLWQQTERKRVVVEDVPATERSLTVFEQARERQKHGTGDETKRASAAVANLNGMQFR